MRRPTFEALREQLLDAGIAPRYADRLHRELRDHYCDLEHEARCCGRSPNCARAEAGQRIGTDEAILSEFKARPELKSWVYRSRALYHVLRALCRCILALRAAGRTIVAHSAMLARFAIAGTLAATVTLSLLLGMGAALKTNEPWNDRAVAAVDNIELTRWRSDPIPRVADPSPPLSPTTASATPVEPGGNGGSRGSVQPKIILQRPTIPTERLVINRPTLPEAVFDTDVTPSPKALQIPTMVTTQPLLVFAPGRVRLADGDLQPLVRVAPVFPAFAAARGMEGYVVVEYTVTSSGSVQDVIVIESSNPVFERPAIEAAAKAKYKPRVVDGRAVPVSGVRILVSFLLEA